MRTSLLTGAQIAHIYPDARRGLHCCCLPGLVHCAAPLPSLLIIDDFLIECQHPPPPRLSPDLIMVSNLLQTRIWTKSQLNSLETLLISLDAGWTVSFSPDLYLMNILFQESFCFKWKSSNSLLSLF